ncbi:MAG: 23S rRNA (uracil(1939)-C(5))-methyltransferase RlmD [Lachnospiraceae bacterium]|nr:23S rRNA (uracil(1939)-C(5))-methyltransferase RlmD [Lachnospiraceae bacterium]
MKKGDIFEGIIEKVEFPNKGIMMAGEERLVIKNAIPGQKVRAVVTKRRKGKSEGLALEVLEKAPKEKTEGVCPHFTQCGGCVYQSLPYEEQLAIKEGQVKELLHSVCQEGSFEWQGLKPSPISDGYRNKMEFSFGDEYKGGPLALGMHKRGSFYDIVTTGDCRIVHPDFCRILTATKEYFEARQVPFHKKLQHTGYLRHLLVRRAIKTGEILVDLVTTTQLDWMEQDKEPQERQILEKQRLLEEKALLQGWKEVICGLSLEGTLAGVLHTQNDSLADVVQNDHTDILFGQDFFYEELLGLRFKITPFSFFQTNSLGAEVLYETARSYIGETKDKVVFDLYSGTGTIAQILAPVASKVVGVEIIPEAVEAAKENAAMNGLENCEFWAGDVLKVIDELEDKPDLIVLDPPRDGIHPKALPKIIDFHVNRIVYVSCKITSLVRDLAVLQERGYQVVKACAVDMFPCTTGIETVCLLSNTQRKKESYITLDVEMADYYRIKNEGKTTGK